MRVHQPETESLHGDRPAKTRRDGSSTKRQLAKGASIALLIAGLGAVAYSGWSSSSSVAPETSSLEANVPAQFVIPTSEDYDDSDETYVPPFELLDRNGDGAISNDEYLRYLAGLRDEAIQRVLSSRLPEATKTRYVSRLRSNYDKEAGCVTRLANRDRQANGKVNEDRFALFHSMITEFCVVEDVTIPAEYQPTLAPLPDEQGDDNPPDELTYPPPKPATYAPVPEPTAGPNPTVQPPLETQPPVQPEPTTTTAPAPPPVVPAPVVTTAPVVPAASPIDSCKDNLISLRSDSGLFMARCEGCARVTNGNLVNSVTIHVPDPTGQFYAQWIVERIDANRVALKVRDVGTYLARCNGCMVGGAYPDSAFLHVRDWREGPWAQWTVETLPNGKVAFKSDTGRYLARCNRCAPGGPADRAFVHSPSSADPWAQWEVGCINGPASAPVPTLPAPTPPPVVPAPVVTSAPAVPVIPKNGQSVRCVGGDDSVFRFVDGAIRRYPNAEIASAWDPLWPDAANMDCSGVARGPDMTPIPPAPVNLPEGQAIKCDANDAAVFRFASGQRRLYPSPAIATSWDPTWPKAPVVDCTTIPRGDDMGHNPSGFSEGQPVNCGNQGFFRFTDIGIRWYANEAIASSWDPNWRNSAVTDCSAFARGPDMPLRFTAIANLPDGQAVKCDASSPEVFRLISGERRLYPSPLVASSWDSNWAAAAIIDCSFVPRGEDMGYNVGAIAEGRAVKCVTPESGTIYRFTEGMIRFYPSPEIASSWDPAYASPQLIDCARIARGPDMPLRPAVVASLPEGQAIKCDPGQADVYRLASGQRRLYPSPLIAGSWDRNWENAVIIDCSIVPRGEDMPFNYASIPNGRSIKCNPAEGAIYRFVDGVIRLYPSPAVAGSWDPNWTNPMVIDCTRVARGSDLADRNLLKERFLVDGQSISCHPLDPAVYRLADGELRLYPSVEVAASWDGNWANPVMLDCTGIPRGPDLELRLRSPGVLAEGQPVKCGPRNDEVYRHTGGMLRWYPSPQIAASWDSNWARWTIIDCTGLPRGPDMAMKQPILAEGQSVKCDRADAAVFRYADGQIRLYPSPDIATSWDGSWGSAVVIDCSRIPRGPDLSAKLPVSARLAEGQPIKCGVKNDEVFRYSGGVRRWYPSPEIASSWDPNWPKWTVVDCTTIPRGADMPRKQFLLSEGQSVKCVGDNVSVYRLVAGSLRLYPSPAIASSWDSNWSSALIIDCSQMARGPDLALKLPSPAKLVEGQSIRCGWDNMEVYRYTGGQRRWYPSEVIASSWDPSFTKWTIVDCSTIPRAVDMPLRVAPPVGDIAEGQTISCRGERERYRYASGLRRLYPTPEIAASWDANLANFLIVDCSRLPQGADMPFNQIAILEGQTVNCKKGDIPIYRYTNGKIRFYPSPAIASSWEAFWGSPVTIDCSKFARGPDMALRATPLESLNEGQAIKCDAAQSEVYRYASGQRRWYPSPAIAASWDREWSKPLVVDCTAIPRGPDMVFKQPVLVEGQTVNCNPGDVPIYRYTDGKIRFYPSPAIANSWDVFWGNPTTIDCTNVPRGPDMQLRLSPLEKLVEGQSIKCDPTQVEVYRFASGQRRVFLSPEAAFSWDPEWTKAVVVDCSAIPRGPDLTVRQPILVEGQTVNCKAGDVPIYRFTEGTIRFYPSPSIANSWDPFWGNPTTIDCSKVQRGPDMVLRLSPISRLVEGQSIKCDPGQVEVYRYASGQRRLYLSVAMAASWDPNWNLPAIVDCGAIPRGPDMTMFTPPPSNVREGRAIKCAANQVEVYRYTSGLRRLYPSPAVATSWDMTWPTSAVVVNCNSIPQGEIMPWNIGLIAEGQAVKCSPSETAIYRIQDGKLRWYPSPESATSWDYMWGSAIVIDCSRVPRGPDMPVKIPPIGKLQEGQSIKCSDRAPEVFRYTSGLRRFYPSPAIATSWDANWANVVVVDCGLLPRGDDMAFNLGNLPEGQSVKCSNSPTDFTVYRVTEGKLRLYPSVESATSWDFMWGSAIPIDCSNIPRGPEMTVRTPPLANIKEGQAIKCAPNQPGVFRYTSGLRRLYPSPAIATSWDINWQGAITVDCTTLPKGDDLTYNVGNLVDGQAIKCADGAVYRFTGGQLRLYPSPEAASSWDRLWFSSLSIDCTGIPRGPEMPVRLLPPRGLPEGQSIRCGPWDAELYRFVAGQRRLYPSPSIAASWNPNWHVHLNVDCTSLPRGPDMERSQPIVREGRAIKCNPAEPAIYRYTNGSIRLYPNPPIAASWDPAWSRPTLIDCQNVPRGPDMGMKLPSPDGLPEGQAIKCDPNDPNVFRLTSGQRRWYPNPEIASSWDPNWGNFKIVDCTGLPRGDDMAFFSLAPKDVREGQAVKCDRGPNVYRYTGGEVRWYPNPPIASSWDPNWGNFVYMDCSKVPRGKDMAMKLPSPDGLPEGQAIKCDPNDPNVFRLTSGQRRWYPNPEIASSWDPNWGNFKIVDCTGLPRGDDMAFFSLAPKDVREGQAVKCDRGPNVYRYTGGEVRWYPNPPIASSWDPNWGNFVYMDCSKVPRGKDMAMKLPSPDGLPEGQAIKCDPNDPNVFRLTSGQRRWYPNPEIASSWDPNWGNFKIVDCTGLPRGDDMAFFSLAPKDVREGQAVKCDRGPNVYRYTGGEVRWYPNPPIASSWDPNWGNFVYMDCSKVPRGKDMAMKLPSPDGLPEGQAIKCDPNDPNVFRLTSGQRRWYPNPEIASSWDPNWGNFKIVDCTGLPRGDDMAFFSLAPKDVREGQAVKCDRGPNVYRYTGGEVRWYPNPPIASSWDPNWGNFVYMDCSKVPRGKDMAMKLPSPDGLPEGQAIKCDPNDPNVFRLTSGQRRWYPNPEIASSWDPNWGNFKIVDCTGLPRGDDMALSSEGWKQLDGVLVQVSYDGRQLCGVNSADDIWCASENIRGNGPTRWRQVPGKLIYVEVYGDVLWGVNRAQQIWVGSSLGDPQWRQLPGSLKQITSDNKQVCGVNANDDIWCANAAIRTNPNWRQIPGKLSFVKLVNGRLVGTNSNGDIFTGRSSGDPAWKQLGGKLRQVTFDGGRLCGTNSNNDVWCADSGLSASPNWSPVPGKRRFVVSNSGEMYAVNDQGGIFYRQM